MRIECPRHPPELGPEVVEVITASVLDESHASDLRLMGPVNRISQAEDIVCSGVFHLRK